MKAVLLTRVSSKEQEEGHSLAAQSYRLHRYCEAKNLEILKEFELVESSTVGDRPAFQKMIAFIKQQKEKIALVCDTVDRLHRSFREVPILESLRTSGKLDLHFVSENQVLDSESNNSQILTYRLFILLAENYANAISFNVKRAFEKKLREGTILGTAPVGYLNVRDDNNKTTVIIDPERGKKVKQLFEKYGIELVSIREMVGYAKSIGLNYRNGKSLSKSQIQYMLHNPFYYGYMKVKGKLYKHIYEPLITKQLFDKCQGISTKRHPVQSKPKNQFLLSRFIRCAYCNKFFSPYLAKHKYPFLTPPPHTICHHFTINQKAVIEVIEEKLKSLQIGDKLDLLLKSLDIQEQSEISNHNKIILEINDQEQDLTNKKTRLMELYLDNKIDKIDFDNKNKELDIQLDYVRTRKEDLDKDIGKFYRILKDCLKIADFSYIFFKSSSNINDKSIIIRSICSNCEIKDKNIVISMKKAFEIIGSKDFRLNWLAAINQLRTTYRLDVLSLNESIQKIKTTNILQ